MERNTEDRTGERIETDKKQKQKRILVSFSPTTPPPWTILRHRRHHPLPQSSSPSSAIFRLLFLPCDNIFFQIWWIWFGMDS